MTWERLRTAAVAAAAHAYAPYSSFSVGAAGLVDDGRIVTGCNVENASYGLTLCAECGLVSELVRTGGGRLTRVLCVNGDGETLMPCGRCRQVLWEHGGPGAGDDVCGAEADVRTVAGCLRLTRSAMNARRFEFTDSWELPASPVQVRDLLVDLERYPEWWTQVRAVVKLGPDDALVLCRSRLPYMLEMTLSARSRELPTVSVEIGGDLVGSAHWTLTETAAGGTRMDFHQDVWLTAFPTWTVVLARPVLVRNHHWMMRGAQRGLAALRWLP